MFMKTRVSIQAVAVLAYLTALTSGHSQSASAYQSGDVLSWGAPVAGPVPGNFSDAKAIAGGGTHSLVLRSNGTVVLWGNNVTNAATFAAGLSNITAIAAGQVHSLALQSNRVVVAWGLNLAGQTTVPPSATNIMAIAAGEDFSLAVRTNGTVVAWGGNGSGQLNVPASATNVIAVSAGTAHALALRGNGTVVAWGANNLGQANVPPGLTGVVAVAAGGNNSLALKNDGTLVGWGGTGTLPPGVSNITAIAAGGAHLMALRSNGTIVSLGTLANGRTQVADLLTNVVAIAEGETHSLAIQKITTPIVLFPPRSFAMEILNPTNFTVTAVGGLPLTYQWQFNGGNIPGGTNRTLNVPPVRLFNVGEYRVIVGNGFGSVTSIVANLTIPNVYGLFNGLFYETNRVAHHSSGMISLQVGAPGYFSGRILVDGDAFLFTGSFAASSDTFRFISRAANGKSDLVIKLHHDQTNTLITGSVLAVTNGGRTAWEAPFEAPLGRVTGTNDIANLAGHYALLIPGFTNDVAGPSGYGFGRVTVGSNNLATIVGYAADGQTLRSDLGTYLTGNGEWPFYVRLNPVVIPVTNSLVPTSVVFKKTYRSSLLGWLNLSGPNRTPAGLVSWIKTAGVPGPLYPAGFTNESAILGSRYTPALPGQRIVAITNVTATVSGGNLTTFTNHFLLTTNNVFLPLPPSTNNQICWRYFQTGLFISRFDHPAFQDGSVLSRGLFLQDQNFGGGFFTGSNRAGRITLTR